jgi:hypothetical protein
MSNFHKITTMRGNFQKVQQMYMKRLAARPLTTKMLTSFCMTTASDIVGQAIGGLPYNVFRTVNFALYSSCFTTCINHAWLEYLDSVIMPDNPKSVKSVVSKTLLDTFVATPLLVSLYLCFVKFAEGRPDEAAVFLVERYANTLMNVWKIGIPLTVTMFAAIPPNLRIPIGSVVGFLFSIFMSVTCVNR